MKQTFTLLCIAIVFILSPKVYAQGNVGINTTTPSEKLDVNGAIIVRTDAASATPVAGTIRWNSTDGMHDGRTSAGTWGRLENSYDYSNGSYCTTGCGATLSTVFGSGATTSNGAETPFACGSPSSNSKHRAQYLILASEMTAAGYCTGSITSIGFVITTLGTSSISSFNISMGNTATSTLTTGGGFLSGLTNVYSPGSAITLVVGNNDFAVSGFSWDGTSNVVIEVCFTNSSSGTNSTVSTVTGLAFNGAMYKALNTGTGCTLTPPAGATFVRPFIRMTGKTYGSISTADYYFHYYKGIVVGSPTITSPYLHHGPGSVTAEAIYDDNTQLTDYVFDKYFDGAVSNEDVALHSEYVMRTLDEMSDYMEMYHHLPTIPGRTEWKTSGQFSIGALASDLWETAETQAIYITELNDRMNAVRKQLTLLENK